MIIIRSPLRISIAGGGTDIPSYYKIKESYFISAAINKYVYVSITKPFEEGIYLKYSQSEKVKNIELIKHKIIKEVLKSEKISNQVHGMLDLMYELPQTENVKKVIINRSAVEGKAKPKLQFYKPSEIRKMGKELEDSKKSDSPDPSADAA